MNNNLFVALQQMQNEHGEDLFNNPKRVQGLLADMAAHESKAEKKALGKCFEMGFYAELKNSSEPEQHKITLANRLAYEEGFAPELCEGSVAIIAALVEGQRAKEEARVPAVNKPKTLCHGCGKELQPEWNLCPNCGTAQGKKQPQPISPPQLRQTQYQPPPSVATKNERTDWVPVLMLFFLLILFCVVGYIF
jgi:hypothetical protein